MAVFRVFLLKGLHAVHQAVSYTHLDVYKRQIGGSETLPPPLTREEELAYMRKMAADDPTARATLIERNPVSYTHLDVYKRQGFCR